jgi:hypothetical protein
MDFSCEAIRRYFGIRSGSFKPVSASRQPVSALSSGLFFISSTGSAMLATACIWNNLPKAGGYEINTKSDDEPSF